MNKLQTILNDEIGRRTEIVRSGTKMTETRSDAYGYNARSELTNAVKNATLNEYAYQYDDIGNRKTSTEPENAFTYTANELNQYTQISEDEDAFTPTYDADGNQTLIRTKTGIWSVTYNGENRPVLWISGTTNIVMKFDRMGRRVEYIECDGAVTNKHQKFVYDGYLCIQRLNGGNNSVTELFEWDPTEPVATRPMFMQYRVPGQTYALFYTHDGNKNVSEVVFYQRARGVAAHYEYSPFGEATIQSCGNVCGADDTSILNPWRFSSECLDVVLGLAHYNYRHYEPVTGKWLCRDLIYEEGGLNLYGFVCNNPIFKTDSLGNDIRLTERGFHQSVCADLWNCNQGKLEKVGEVCFSFAFNGSFMWSSGSTTWLGEDSLVFPGFVMEGWIYEDDNPGTIIVSSKQTDPCEDMKWVAEMYERVYQCDVYSLGRHNCRKFSQHEFDKISGK